MLRGQGGLSGGRGHPRLSSRSWVGGGDEDGEGTLSEVETTCINVETQQGLTIREIVSGLGILGFSGLRWAVVAAKTEEATCLDVTTRLVI